MFTFIVYKASSVDYARGCRIGSYEDDCQVFNNLDADALAIKWSIYLHKNMNLDHSETGYLFWIFKGGVMVFDRSSTYCDIECRYDEDALIENEQEIAETKTTLLTEIDAVYEKARVNAQARQDAQLRQNRIKEQEEIQKRAESEKEARRKQFEKLKAEFEG